ncbi:Agenet domain-containing protein [Cephalotus follicularis]|uniref:Agenet domain-containing protein n=1 Tax=Cephalotus follicularis TaxID=3775 RepID=A0A1Q3BYK3_CEPFO|nr:Agenet domain-containing protein [Cephalotus follicularis]
MRFKKGSNVEVLSKMEVPSGSWRCAEIICGNGHNYTVRYAGTTNEEIAERVSRNAIRPCCPLLEVSESWVPGDVVEVFDNFSWKMATVSKALGKKHFLVRLLASSLEFKVGRADIRLRQSWQDEKWVVIGKGSGNCEDGKCHEIWTLKYNQHLGSQFPRTKMWMNSQANGDCFPVKKKTYFQESHTALSKNLKRGSPYDNNSRVEGYADAAQKVRVIEKGGRFHRAIAANSSNLPKQET